MFHISAIQRDRLGREKVKSSSRILRLLANPTRLIITILMGNELVNVSIAAISAALFLDILPGNRWAPVLSITLLLLLIGEITPKSVAISRPMLFSRTVSLPLSLFSRIVSPVSFLAEKLVRGLAFLFGKPEAEPLPISEAEFRQLAVVGAAEGELAEEEADMIIRVFDLGETTVAHTMTPRTEIQALPSDTSVDEAITKMRNGRYSRMPVFEDTLDNVVGILHANDLLKHLLAEDTPPLSDILRPCLYIPESMKADDLLRSFRNYHSHMAIVIDEYGGTAGLVTLDDIVGELFDEIRGEGSEEIFTYRICENGELIVAGDMELDEFSELVKTDFSDVPMETVGGMVFHYFGHMPAQGDIIRIRKLRVTVLTVRDNRVWRIRVAKGVIK